MNIFVGCGARLGVKDEYAKIAYEIGKYIGSNNHTLVFGAFSEGLMGAVYKGYKDHAINYDVHGYTKDRWIKNFDTLELTKKDTTSNVQERKQLFFDDSDAFIILPGGLGTLDELISTIECKETEEFDKPLIILNIDDFYTPILNFFNKINNDNLAIDAKNLFTVTTSLEETIDVLNKLK